MGFAKPEDRLLDEFTEANKDSVVSTVVSDLSGSVAKELAKRFGLSEQAAENAEIVAAELACFLYYCSRLEKLKAKTVLQLALFQAVPFILNRAFKLNDKNSQKAGLLLSLIQTAVEYRHAPAEGVAYFVGEQVGNKAWTYDPKKAQLIFYALRILKAEGSKPSP